MKKGSGHSWRKESLYSREDSRESADVGKIFIDDGLKNIRPCR